MWLCLSTDRGENTSDSRHGWQDVSLWERFWVSRSGFPWTAQNLPVPCCVCSIRQHWSHHGVPGKTSGRLDADQPVPPWNHTSSCQVQTDCWFPPYCNVLRFWRVSGHISSKYSNLISISTQNCLQSTSTHRENRRFFLFFQTGQTTGGKECAGTVCVSTWRSPLLQFSCWTLLFTLQGKRNLMSLVSDSRWRFTWDFVCLKEAWATLNQVANTLTQHF